MTPSAHRRGVRSPVTRGHQPRSSGDHRYLEQPRLSVTVSVSVTVVWLRHGVLPHQGPQGVAAVQDLRLSHDTESDDTDDDLLDV